MTARRARWLTGILLSGLLVWVALLSAAGDPGAALASDWHVGHRVTARDGQVLRDLPTELGQRGQPLPLEALGDRLVLATLVSEDERFYEHGGVDGVAVVRALGQNVRHRRVVSGASTVTQQLVKLLDSGGRPQTSDRNVHVKVSEAARATNLEQQLDKRTILEAYLNRLSYGRGYVGPAAAAEGYFGVAPSELSWAQAALMAVLPRAPSHLDPVRHPDRARVRQARLLEEIHAAGLMSDADLERALAEPWAIQPDARPFAAPHLVEALRQEQLGGLAEGHETRTTIDLELQRDVESLVAAHRPRLAEARANNAAVMVVDNHSGEVLAYLGSAAFHDDAISGQIDMARAPRQPGSTLKPFIYALAFARGVQPTDPLPDVPTDFHGYAPGNFSGAYLGPVPAREALAGSLNVPAVQLASSLPREELAGSLTALGVRELDVDELGLSLALGSAEISMVELATAYVALARGGDAIDLRFRIDADAGRPVAAGRRVLDAAACAAVTEALADPVARVRGLGGTGPFAVGFPVAVKTGTSSGFRDGWTVGYTADHTVAVWVGNADASPMNELTGGRGAGPIFADVMRRVARDLPQSPLVRTSLLEAVEICPLSGQPAGASCPHRRRAWQLPGETPTAGMGEGARTPCSFHRRCGEHGEAVVLPAEYADWLAAQPEGAPGRDTAGLPWLAEQRCQTGVHDRPETDALRFLQPAADAIFLSQGGARGQTELDVVVAGVDEPVEILVDGEVVTRLGVPQRTHIAVGRGDHEIEARTLDPTSPRLPARVHIHVR